MNTSKHHISKLSKMSTQLPDLIASLDAATTDLAQRMAELKAQGLIYATEHWKDQKYMTLLYPIQAGQPRKRVYVGKDPVKVEDAKAKIQRAKDYEALAAKAKRLDETLMAGFRRLQEAASVLERAK